MGFLSKLFGKKESHSSKQPQHAVIVNFQYGSTDLQPIFDLEKQLGIAINEAEAGEFDGNAIAEDGSDGFLYMYGPNADQLFAVVRPVLESVEFMKEAVVTLQYGPPEDGVEEKQVTLGR